MSKKNENTQKKVSKWDVAPKSIKDLYFAIGGVFDGLSSIIDPEEADNEDKALIDLLTRVLDDYNELEAKHQKDTGMISEYAEENARLKQKNEKASNNIRDLRQVLEENDIATYLNPVTVSWGVANIALQKKTEHFNTQLDNLREKLKEAEKSKEKWIAHYHDMSDICSRDEDDSEMLQAILREDGYTIEYDGDIDDETIRCQDSFDLCKETTQDKVKYQYGRWTLIRPSNFSEAKANADAAILRNQCSRHIVLLDKLRGTLEDKGIHCEWNESAFNWNLTNTANICKSWSCKQHFEEELRIRCKEIDDKNKLIEELRQKIEDLESKNKSLKTIESMKESVTITRVAQLHRDIENLKKENNNLTTDNKRLSNAVEAWFDMFNDMRHKRDLLKKEYEKLKETNKSLRRTVNILDREDYI